MSDESSTGSSSRSCDCQNCAQNVRILLSDSSQEFFTFLDYHASNYRELNPHIGITIEAVRNLEFEMLESDDWDGSIFPSQLIGNLTANEVLWDLNHFIRSSASAAWTELLPFLRNPSSVFHMPSDDDEGEKEEHYKAIPFLIPLDGDLLSMYYRRDLFQQYNLTIPRTWDEYNTAAAFFDGMPLGPGGSPLSGSCISRVDGCSNDYWTSLILASMTQSFGTSSGFFLDPSTMDPLFGKAMEETLRIMSEQRASGHDDELTGDCLLSNMAFNQGNCALTYNWGNQITLADSVLFDVGVAPTPGSPVVLDRRSGKLVNCTPAICPHAKYYDDIGLINQAPYAAYGGWVAGVSSRASESRQYAVADFLAYVSNSQQSLEDVLPNNRSSFVQPFRYSHIKSSNWIDAGFGRSLALDYTEAIRRLNSENAVLELRVPSAAHMRGIVDQEVFDYLMATANYDLTQEEDLSLRRKHTARMEDRIQELVKSKNQHDDDAFRLSALYPQSIGHSGITDIDQENYINEDFRSAAWGLSGLMCVTCVTLMVWTLRHRNNRVMKAFQPFLLLQSTFGLLLMSASIIPLGFDDSGYDVELLDITCMISPWLYVVGFTIFFSSVYSKIRECMKIYKDPQNHNILLVQPMSCIRLCTRLLILNGTILGLWTGLDPLQWVREDVEGGIVLEDGSVETYGACRGGYPALAFAIVLYVLNMLITLIATLQAFKCRFLVLEYNEMQWLPLSVFPFLEVWLIGGPILPLVRDDPTITFVVLTMMIVVSTSVGGMAVFAPKDWYIRKFYHSNPKRDTRFPERTGSAGIMVLQHPTVESQKQIESLSFKVEQMEGWNTELEIEIRMMKEKLKVLTTTEKFHIRESIINASMADADTPEYRGSKGGMDDYEQTEISKSNDDDLAAVEQFQQVWRMPDDEEDEDHHPPAPLPKQASFHSRAESFVYDEDQPNSRSEEMSSYRSRPVSQSKNAFSDSFSELPEDPLARIMRMAEEDNESPKPSPRVQRSPKPPPKVQRSTATNRDNGPQDPLELIAMMDDEDNVGPQDPLSRISITEKEGSFVEDPSVRLAALDDESDRSPDPPPPKPKPPAKKKSTPQQKRQETSDEDIIKRIIAMRLAAAEKGEDGNDSPRSTPEDPLERIMNMNAEDQLISAAALMRYLDPQDDDDEEDDDVIIRKRDFQDLSSMIYDNDLEELEKRAAKLAESVKSKLTVSSLADLTRETATTVDDSDTGMGYLALAMGGHKDSINTSHVMNGLDISKISNDEDGDRRFVSMSDSILDSPSRITSNDRRDGLVPEAPDRRDGLVPGAPNGGFYSPRSKASAGESSSADAKQRSNLSAAASAALEQGDHYATQLAGEPSQGESTRFALGLNGRKETINDVAFRSPKTPTKKPLGLRKLSFQEEESPAQENKSYAISDWAAVGGLANVLADWSDSQSSTSYAESSIPDSSVASVEATTRASALETPIAKELDQLVGNMDWDGVKVAAENYEMKGGASKAIQTPPALSTSYDGVMSALEEKRKKKRELEAWKNSLAKSFTKTT